MKKAVLAAALFALLTVAALEGATARGAATGPARSPGYGYSGRDLVRTDPATGDQTFFCVMGPQNIVYPVVDLPPGAGCDFARAVAAAYAGPDK